ncbi:hypothetical protein C1H46_025593 [Malus baccata]|uniref:Uncharacterized protein n=1 Tax=Malus baccata TaxID=106549 RepID=A0A540LRA0_MALBA|nr:hypothetical protein C1H46_025593 [Malus baccata]
MEEYFSKALYTFDIGQNDLGEGFSDNKTIHEVNASVPDIVSMFSTNIKGLSSLLLLVVAMGVITTIAIVLNVEQQSKSMEAKYLLVHANGHQLE